jgi:ribonuclease HII
MQQAQLFQRPGPEAGVDEAGRGPLAGPVVAAAVILDPRHPIDGLADSKTLSESRREALAEEIRCKALAWSVAAAEVAEIDALNILEATMLAMRRAVLGLTVNPGYLKVDGNRMPLVTIGGEPVAGEAVVRGDATVPAISAASVLAKTARDRIMVELDGEYPEYGFARHKGYGTAAHLESLRRHGPCKQHRQSFAPVRAAG